MGFRGDWKDLVMLFNFDRHYNTNKVCEYLNVSLRKNNINIRNFQCQPPEGMLVV